MENDVTRPIFGDSSTTRVEADNTHFTLDKPLPQVTALNNMAKNQVEPSDTLLLIDFTQDLQGHKPSRLPPDGHEFPPSFKEPIVVDDETTAIQLTNGDVKAETEVDKMYFSSKTTFTVTSNADKRHSSPAVVVNLRKNTDKTNMSLQEKIAMFSHTQQQQQQQQEMIIKSPKTQESPVILSKNDKYDIKPFNTLPRKMDPDWCTNFDKRNSITSSSSSWYSLLESRKQKVSKLRGLVIPEKQGQNVTNIIPMPVIASNDRISKVNNNNNNNLTPFGSLPRNFNSRRDSNSNLLRDDDNLTNLAAPPWKDVSASNLPKYSPAFKRKALTLLDDPGRPRSATAPQLLFSSHEIPPKPEILSVTVSKLPNSPSSELEDKDSVISSSGSTFSQSLSPPVSPFQVSSSQSQTEDDDVVEEYVVTRITDANSEQTETKVVLKKSKEKVARKSSVEALNRRNVLEQAKYSSGCSEDEVDAQKPISSNNSIEPTTHFHYRSHSDVICGATDARVEAKISKCVERLKQETGKSGGIKSFRELADQWESKKALQQLQQQQQTRRKSLPATAFRPSAAESSTRPRSDTNHNLGNGRKIPTQRYGNKGPSTSVGDLLKMFEQQQKADAPTTNGKTPTARNANGDVGHARMSSQDSTASESEVFLPPAHYGSVNSLSSNQFGSISSLASSTSIISQQELQQLLDDANHSLEESGTPQHEIIVVVLHREIAGGNIGITLAGGADYEAKEITVHKVIIGSLADRDGRIQKGDRVISINGKNVKGITHKEALNLLKAPRPECVLVLSRNSLVEDKKKMSSIGKDNKVLRKQKRNSLCVDLVKDGAGLGFSLDGGKESPVGDKPLTIKKIFLGGSADKCESLKIGDEIISINGTDVTSMSRIEAWNLIKKLPEGKINVAFRQA